MEENKRNSYEIVFSSEKYSFDDKYVDTISMRLPGFQYKLRFEITVWFFRHTQISPKLGQVAINIQKS